MTVPIFQIMIQRIRIPQDHRSLELHYYEIRHGDNLAKPETLEKCVTANLWGMIISTVSLDGLFKKKDYFSLTSGHRILLYQYCHSDKFIDGRLFFPVQKINKRRK